MFTKLPMGVPKTRGVPPVKRVKKSAKQKGKAKQVSDKAYYQVCNTEVTPCNAMDLKLHCT
jgi:hypothetical protein